MKLNKVFAYCASVAVVASGMAGLSSCSDDLELYPIDYFSATGFWKTQTEFEGNIVALMNQWRGSYSQTHIQLAGEKRGGGYFADGTTTGLSSATGTSFINSQLSETSPGFSNFANYYGFIANANSFIYYAENAGDILTEEARAGMLGIIYGMRAAAYFDLYRMYGTCPIRTDNEVILGNYDPKTLRKPRAKSSEVVAQIRSDIAKSLENFANAGSYVLPAAKGNKVYFWSKAATEMLAGEAYMWTAKVSTGDWTAAGQPDITTAKGYFNNVVNNYGFALCNSYESVFSVENKQNSEEIFALNYKLDVATVGTWARQYQWPNNYGVPGRYFTPEGQRLGYTYNAATDKLENTDFLLSNNFEPTYTQYKNAYYYQFDKNDQRSEVWIPVYNPNPGEESLNYVENFDPEDHYLAGAFFFKYKGQKDASGMNATTNDLIWYRLPLAYTYLAEIANYEGDWQGVADNFNKLRARAYGALKDEEVSYPVYPVTSDFLANEVAILHEKDKEFICEGQRWWDICRMTVAKDGTPEQHLVFQPQSCIGYGLNVTGKMCEVNNELSENLNDMPAVVTDKPVLDYATQRRFLLYPLDAALLESDPELVQTEGYTTEGQQ